VDKEYRKILPLQEEHSKCRWIYMKPKEGPVARTMEGVRNAIVTTNGSMGAL
jgi:hypothetical protein